ncbi:MAG TPA: hypothetical protein VF190_07220 [Rhodothermales bacterium]|jgi:hypothetical protein
MERKILEQIRHDLDLVFPEGGYRLTEQQGKPALRLTWDESVHENARRFSEEIVRLHNVSFETGVARTGAPK